MLRANCAQESGAISAPDANSLSVLMTQLHVSRVVESCHRVEKGTSKRE